MPSASWIEWLARSLWPCLGMPVMVTLPLGAWLTVLLLPFPDDEPDPLSVEEVGRSVAAARSKGSSTDPLANASLIR